MEVEKNDSSRKRPDLAQKLKAYNSYHNKTSSKLNVREVNGRLVLEGKLRFYWKVSCAIHLKLEDGTSSPPKTPPAVRQQSYILAIHNGYEDSMDNDPVDVNDNTSTDDTSQTSYSNHHGVLMRKKSANVKNRKKILSKRKSVINGHFYDQDTSVFIPSHDTMTSVHVTSLDNTHIVKTQLLGKFHVLNDPSDFCLCVVKVNGECRILGEYDYPLIERVLMGPLEDEANLYIYETGTITDISEIVARYSVLPEPVLHGFLQRLADEEENELYAIKKRYSRLRSQCERLQQVSKLEEGSTVTKL